VAPVIGDHDCPQGHRQFRKSIARDCDSAAGVFLMLQVDDTDHEVGATDSFDLF
jgi:hypothetical protein